MPAWYDSPMYETPPSGDRISVQRKVMALFIEEKGGSKQEALDAYLARYASHFDDVFRGHERDTPEDLLRALHEEVDGTVH